MCYFIMLWILINNLDAYIADDASNHKTQNKTLANTEFKTHLKYNIPSDGNGHIVALQSTTLLSIYNYLVVPKLDPSAFLIARITEWKV